MTYNWQQEDWPKFRYDLAGIEKSLFLLAEKFGLIQGKLTHLTDSLQTEAIIDLLVEEAIKTSAIEGEFLSRPDVRSSIKNRLGLNKRIIKVHDRRAEGIVDMMLDIRDKYKKPLTETDLCEWNLMLLASNPDPNLQIGCYRTDPEPMQIVSGYHDRRIVHFEAPPANIIPTEMKNFILWFNQTAPNAKLAINIAPVRAAIAHLYFESIHPFEDGNGRIGRAIAEKALSQTLGYPVILSLSHSIETHKKEYYEALNRASKTNEITSWIAFFVSMVLDAQIHFENNINFILRKINFFDQFKNKCNARQLKVIERMLSAGKEGFEGGMSAKKYMIIANTSKATATRDLQELVDMQAVTQIGEGRSVRYELNL